NHRTWVDIAGWLLGALFLIGLWRGRRWAFTLWFVFTSLALVVSAIAYVFIPLPEAARFPIAETVLSLIQLALLMHPATKRFAGTERSPLPQADAPTPAQSDY
ncbi:MAG TPA: hypothetical protein VNP73_01405, partial [Actinomycetota bacterium]|nr:hypothetical protein [Actinomycetota bacterium]